MLLLDSVPVPEHVLFRSVKLDYKVPDILTKLTALTRLDIHPTTPAEVGALAAITSLQDLSIRYHKYLDLRAHPVTISDAAILIRLCLNCIANNISVYSERSEYR